jgi:hypothetical protein
MARAKPATCCSDDHVNCDYESACTATDLQPLLRRATCLSGGGLKMSKLNNGARFCSRPIQRKNGSWALLLAQGLMKVNCFVSVVAQVLPGVTGGVILLTLIALSTSAPRVRRHLTMFQHGCYVNSTTYDIDLILAGWHHRRAKIGIMEAIDSQSRFARRLSDPLSEPFAPGAYCREFNWESEEADCC